MKDASENAAPRKLATAIREVKNGLADRDDVVVDMREAHRMRLELMAAELAGVFEDVPDDLDMFDFAISSGLQPRLWIDAVAHVAMGRDRRTYRFVRDTRQGRVVLAESTAIEPVANQVTRYIAERIVERQRMLDAGTETGVLAGSSGVATSGQDMEIPAKRSRWPAFLSGLAFVGAGAVAGLVLSLILFWDRIRALGLIF
ncbi:hypothetical protein [Aquamicrobium defluvii]|uniref:Uncharacterized protein n=1 Tax=Aquamicrobium defluvii TaxID=69279 RepID=A0A011SYX5_9HYPH|nr:hypothetical protein [Aquamicrobium defluvii]EXL04449.1 hypothetical protein BG36_10010 [Aquamicrobium defluvii]EZQ14133.1 hypothetical protein CF98_21310 [Halopseudomonas bauzanensis]TDR34460.1 hypothetical protein DES43_11466 [Aquamicrobium defluvii]